LQATWIDERRWQQILVPQDLGFGHEGAPFNTQHDRNGIQQNSG
jgi:hypothetical protein